MGCARIGKNSDLDLASSGLPDLDAKHRKRGHELRQFLLQIHRETATETHEGFLRRRSRDVRPWAAKIAHFGTLLIAASERSLETVEESHIVFGLEPATNLGDLLEKPTLLGVEPLGHDDSEMDVKISPATPIDVWHSR